MLRRAKQQLAYEENLTSALLRREMRSVARTERINTRERARRWIELLTLARSAQAVVATIKGARDNVARRASAMAIQNQFRKFVIRRRDAGAAHIKHMLGMRVVLVIANLRAKIKKRAAQVVTAFVEAIPASTKVFVSLRLFRVRVKKIQQWWRSFLACKLARLRCLLRIWNIKESANRQQIRSAVAAHLRKERQQAAKSALSALQQLPAVAEENKHNKSIATTSATMTSPMKSAKELRRLAKGCQHHHQNLASKIER